MKANKITLHCLQGFTLIELLVVILIIGILAAIALPQYQFAVVKSRTLACLPLLKSIGEAQERYYLEHGEYTNIFPQLDIDFKDSCTNSFLIDLGGARQHASLLYCPGKVKLGYGECNSNKDFEIRRYYQHITDSNAGKRTCVRKTDLGTKICNSLTLN